MKKNTLLGILCAALLMLNLGLTASIFWLKPKSHHHPPHRADKKALAIVVDKLDLNDQQSKAFEEMREIHMLKNELLNDQLFEAYDQLYQLLVTTEVDQNKKTILLRSIEGLTTQLNTSNLEHFLELKSILRDDQVENYNLFTSELRRRFGPIKDMRTAN